MDLRKVFGSAIATQMTGIGGLTEQLAEDLVQP